MFLLKLWSKYKYKKAIKNGLQVGKGCCLGDIDFGSEPWLIEIGNNVGSSSKIKMLTHDGGTWVLRKYPECKNVIKYGKIKVCDNVFIGCNVIIMPGVTIGENSVIGAGSVVTRDVEPNTVYAGNPAHFICTIEEYKNKCIEATPDYDVEEYHQDKRKVVTNLLDGKMKF